MTYDFKGIKQPDEMFYEHIGDFVIHVYDNRDNYERFSLVREYENVGPEANLMDNPYVFWQYKIKDYKAFDKKYPGLTIKEYDLYEYARRDLNFPYFVRQDNIVWRIANNERS